LKDSESSGVECCNASSRRRNERRRYIRLGFRSCNKYAHAAAAHGRATVEGDYKTANKQYTILVDVYRMLRSRGPEAQRAVLTLLEHGDPHVRCWAASHALEFAPDLAERILSALAKGRGVAAPNAETILEEWKGGTLQFP